MASQADVAEHLDLSDRSIRELRDKGVFRDNGRGQWDLQECRIAYIRHLRERAAGRVDENGDDADGFNLKRERALLIREQRERVAIANAKERGELVPLADFNAAVLSVIALVKGRLLRIPAKVAKADSALKARIADAVDDALGELSMARVEEALGEGDGEEADDA